MKINKLVPVVAAIAAAVLVAAPASAAIDTASVTAGISEAGTALLSVVGALMALSVSLFGISKVYAFIKRKAGA